MNEMFTEAARKAIEYARDEASRLKHDYIGTEHLLLGVELDEKLFRSEAKEGDTGVVPVQSGAIVYTITKLQGFDQADFEAQKEGLRIELLGQHRNALVGSVLEKLRGQYEVEINREMMARMGS